MHIDNQIKQQIEGEYFINILHSDLDTREGITLTEQDGKYWIKPIFKQEKKIDRFDFEAICNMSENFIANTETRDFEADTFLTYDEFMHKFYNTRKSESLESYISMNFNSNLRFANLQNVKAPQVTQWKDKKFIVVDDILYSPRRELNRET